MSHFHRSGSRADERRGASGQKKVAMGRKVSLDDPEHCWLRSREARAVAEWMPDPDTRRLTLAVAENYERLARHLEAQLQQHTDGHSLGGIEGRSDDKGHA
jgi:hypothetical protein